jgi:hypothetical protein
MTAWIALGWTATAGPFIGLSATLAWMRLRTRRGADTDTLFDTLGFSLERYKPMERLLSPEDFSYLTQMPGYRPEMGRQWKRDRRRLFRLYLNELAVDFNTLHSRARAVLAETGTESGELVAKLAGQKFAFWRTLAAIDLRLTMDALGVGSVDPRPLLQLVEAMRLELDHAGHYPAQSAI